MPGILLIVLLMADVELLTIDAIAFCLPANPCNPPCADVKLVNDVFACETILFTSTDATCVGTVLPKAGNPNLLLINGSVASALPKLAIWSCDNPAYGSAFSVLGVSVLLAIAVKS